MPPLMNNHGNYIVSLGDRLPLARPAGRGAGRRDLSGLRRRRGALQRGRLGAGRRHRRHGRRQGRQAQGRTTRRAWSCMAKYTLIAEGVRGSLAKQLMAKFDLRDGVDPQKFGIGLKELWQVEPAKFKKGLVVHSQGWPLQRDRQRTAAPSCTISATTSCPSASWCTSTTRTPTSRRSTSSSASRPIPRSPSTCRAASGWPTARAPSTRAACSRCPSSPSRAAR